MSGKTTEWSSSPARTRANSTPSQRPPPKLVVWETIAVNEVPNGTTLARRAAPGRAPLAMDKLEDYR